MALLSYGMPASKNKFLEPVSYDHIIGDAAAGGGKIGELRIKPSSILWKPKGKHQFFRRHLTSLASGLKRTAGLLTNRGVDRQVNLRLYAVTRCLEIISEASRRLPDELKARQRQLSGVTWPPPEIFIAMNTRTLPRGACGEHSWLACRCCSPSLSRNFKCSTSPAWRLAYTLERVP